MLFRPQVGTLLARERGHCEQVVNCLKISELVSLKLAVERYLKIQVYLTCGEALWSTVVEKAENFWKMNFIRGNETET